MVEEQKTAQIQRAKPAREPSQEETAVMIADQLGETGDAEREHCQHIVRTLGRSQSRRLLRGNARSGIRRWIATTGWFTAYDCCRGLFSPHRDARQTQEG